MGAADVIPGVSGGTVAFITGIYEELINSIKAVDLNAFKLLFSLRIAAFWGKKGSDVGHAMELCTGKPRFAARSSLRALESGPGGQRRRDQHAQQRHQHRRR